MQIRQLTYFLAVVDHGGISRAASVLNVAQPTLSKSIAAFERELGTPLFHRVGRGLVLSTSGADLVGPARTAIRSMQLAEAAVGSWRAPAESRLDIVASPTPGVEPLAGLLSTYFDEHPESHLEISEGLTPDRVLGAVRSGEAEIGILGTRTVRQNPGLRTIDLEPQPLVLISRPGAEVTPGEEVDVRALRGARLIVPQRGSLIRSLIDEVIDRGDFDATIVAEVSLRAAIVPLVLGGIGQAILASGWADLARRAGAVVQTLVPHNHLYIAVVSRDEALTPAAQSFMELAARHRVPRSAV